MSDDPKGAADDDDEAVDVKAKMAQMSGFQIRQRRAEASRAGKQKHLATARAPVPEPVDTEEPPFAEPVVVPSDVATPEPMRPRLERPAASEAAPAVGPAVVFVAGLLVGLAPLVVSLGLGAVSPAAPDGVPEEAVARHQDWIACSTRAGDGWSCVVYGGDGAEASRGQFVAAPGYDGDGDWDTLAADGDLVPHGWQQTPRARLLYVRGVKVETTPTRGNR